jgi:hypothetical protein
MDPQPAYFRLRLDTDAFPIDVTDPDKLRQLRDITLQYMDTPEQRAKMDEIASIFKGRKPTRQGRLRRWLSKLA